jgi:hypothetical protein
LRSPSSLRSGRDVRRIVSFESTPVKMIEIGCADALAVRTGDVRLSVERIRLALRQAPGAICR